MVLLRDRAAFCGKFAHNTNPLGQEDPQLPSEEPYVLFQHLFSCIRKHIYCHWHFLAPRLKHLPLKEHTRNPPTYSSAAVTRDQKPERSLFAVFSQGFASKSQSAWPSCFAPVLLVPEWMWPSPGARGFQHPGSPGPHICFQAAPASPPGRKETWQMASAPPGACITQNEQ